MSWLLLDDRPEMPMPIASKGGCGQQCLLHALGHQLTAERCPQGPGDDGNAVDQCACEYQGIMPPSVQEVADHHTAHQQPRRGGDPGHTGRDRTPPGRGRFQLLRFGGLLRTVHHLQAADVTGTQLPCASHGPAGSRWSWRCRSPAAAWGSSLLPVPSAVRMGMRRRRPAR